MWAIARINSKHSICDLGVSNTQLFVYQCKINFSTFYQVVN